ncbi:hypothetical protein VE04_05605 [Pseudogymnoascus sp. 24MN13]|nr:hypothetical protein VE04_05605 [Pseudogymnoascus sp. 24MN13]
MSNRYQSNRRDYHIVVLGAGGVGKSCLTAQFVQNVWIESYDPTIEDSYRKQIQVDGRQCMLEILDTAGTEQFTAMRASSSSSPSPAAAVASDLPALREQITGIKDDEHVPDVIVGNKSEPRRRPHGESVQGVRAEPELGRCAVLRDLGEATSHHVRNLMHTANVDEVFIDLCRQIIRKGNDVTQEPEYEPEVPKKEKTRRHLLRRKDRSSVHDFVSVERVWLEEGGEGQGKGDDPRGP